MILSHKNAPLLGLATLAALGLAAPHAARAGTTVTGGASTSNTVTGYFATAAGSPYVVTGGPFNDNPLSGLETFSFSTVTINGGTFNDNAGYGVYANGSVTVNGGTFTGNVVSGLLADYGSNVTVNGGTFTGNNVSGQYGADLFAQSTGIITVYGTDFTYDGTNNFDGTVSGDANGYGSFTGDIGGVTQALTFDENQGGTIILAAPPPAAVPEPSTIAPFACAGLGLLGLTLRARRRNRSGSA